MANISNGGGQITATASLAKPDWKYIEPLALDDFRGDDWKTLDAQRAPFQTEHQADQVLRLITATAELNVLNGLQQALLIGLMR